MANLPKQVFTPPQKKRKKGLCVQARARAPLQDVLHSLLCIPPPLLGSAFPVDFFFAFGDRLNRAILA